MANFVIAIFWLLVGLAFILLPDFAGWRIRGTEISIGWVAIALACYNLLRWFLVRRGQRPRYPGSDVPQKEPREYHPDLDFTKDKPDAGDQRFKSS